MGPGTRKLGVGACSRGGVGNAVHRHFGRGRRVGSPLPAPLVDEKCNDLGRHVYNQESVSSVLHSGSLACRVRAVKLRGYFLSFSMHVFVCTCPCEELCAVSSRLKARFILASNENFFVTIMLENARNILFQAWYVTPK